MARKLYIEITNICNLDCSFCHKTKREKSMMTEEQFNYIIDNIKEYINFIFFHIMGEPTVHPKLPLFIDVANNHGLKTVLTTNGTLLHLVGDKLVNSHPHRINISLHSYEANSNNLHSSIDSYILSCLDFAKKCSKNNIFCVLRLWNLGGLDEENNHIMSIIKREFPEPWVSTRKGYRIANMMFIEWDDYFEWPDINNNIYHENCSCLGVSDQIGILCDGTVVPCCLDSEGVVNLGNIFNSSFEAIYNSERTRNIINGFKKRHAVEQLCRHCGYCTRFKH